MSLRRIRPLRRLALGAVALSAGAAAAVVSSTGAVATAAADIPIYTSTTPEVVTAAAPDVVTSATPEVVTSTTPEIVTAPEVPPFEAAKVAFHRSTQIKRLPRAQGIRALPSRGWAISAPARCTALCVYAGTLLARNVGVWYSDAYAFAAQAPAGRRPRSAILGSVEVSGTGALEPEVTIRRAFRRKLLRARRPVRVRLTQVITDSQHGFVRERIQDITLRPRSR